MQSNTPRAVALDLAHFSKVFFVFVFFPTPQFQRFWTTSTRVQVKGFANCE